MRTILATILLSALGAGPLVAQEVERRSATGLTGRDSHSGTRFAAATLGGSSRIFELDRNGLRLQAVVGIDRVEFALESRRDGAGGPARLTSGDRAALHRVARALDGSLPLDRGFLRLLNLLSSWPAGLPLQAALKEGVVTTADGSWELPEGEAAEDICSKMNRSHHGDYPVSGIPRHFDDLGIVGPHPWSAGDCLGRCGAGCPGDGPPNNSVYAFWQDCFDHDACVRDQGLLDLDCNLIFPAAFDDFLYGASCQKDNVDIVINGQDGPLAVNAGDPIQIRLSLMNVPSGTPADYWLYVRTTAGTAWLAPGGRGWVLGPPVAAHQGVLVEVDDFVVYEGPLPAGFPSGRSTFYLSVDRNRDGLFEPRQFEDAVDVLVN